MVIFLFCHLTFFIYNPVPAFSRDTYSYYDPIKQLFKGDIPLFNIRTPGYPLFLFAVEMLFSTAKSVLLSQAVSMFLVVIILLWLFKKHYKSEFVYLGTALLIFYASPMTLAVETAFLTECLYTCFILLSVGFFMAALRSHSKTQWVISSVLVGITIIIRQQAYFLIAAMVLIIIFLLINKRKKEILSLALPFLLVLLPVYVYNSFTIGRFVLSEFGAAANLGSSVFYIETDSSYPKKVNDLISQTNNSFNPADKEIINNSWNYRKLQNAFSGANYDKFWTLMYQLNDSVDDFNNREMLDMANKIAKDAKKKHPKIYAKFFINSMIGFNENIAIPYYFYFNEIINRCHFFGTNEFVRDPYSMKLVMKEYAGIVQGIDSINKSKTYQSEEFMSEHLKNEPLLIKLNHYFELIYSKIFRNYLWIVIFWLIYLYAFYMLIRSKGKNREYFLIFNTGNLMILSSILVSMVIIPVARYSYSTEFVYYFLPALLIPLLLEKFKARKKKLTD